MVGNVLLLLLFLLLVFGILGVALIGDSVHQQCVRIVGGEPVSTDGFQGLGYGFEVLESPAYEYQTCAVHPRPAWPGFACPEGFDCRRVGAPNQGLFRFDTVPWAMFNVFLVLSLERWSLAMYWVQDATSGFSAIYFIVAISIGTFFILNLTLAVRNSRSTARSPARSSAPPARPLQPSPVAIASMSSFECPLGAKTPAIGAGRPLRAVA